MRFVLRKEIISLLLTIGLGLSGCATQEQIRAELESEEGRALIKEAVREEIKSIMKIEEHKAKMKEQMKEMMKKEKMKESRMLYWSIELLACQR